MMDWTDRHCRAFHRTFSHHARLYTEMVTALAVIHGDRQRLIGFNETEHPVAIQLGSSDPAQLAQAARICSDFGYDEINLNVGCPSDRVQGGNFGACLMREPALVADCVAAMKAVVAIPVTVKCRIGVDDQDPEEALDTLADAVIAAGTDALVVHARKAWLKGLSPRENRDIPPLDYDRVRRLKKRLPHIPIALNGGLKSIDEGLEACGGPDDTALDGMMLGRIAYHEPELLHEVDPRLYGKPAPHSDTFEALKAFEPYIATHLEGGGRLSEVTRHMLGLFGGKRGSRLYRRHLATEAVKPGAGLNVLRDAVHEVRQRMRSPEEDD